MDFNISLGSYEGSLVGWDSISTVNEERQVWQSRIRLAYALHNHNQSVRCVASDTKSGHVLATGGADEQVLLYNLRTRKAIGGLHDHKDEVTALQFVGANHLLSADKAGHICVYHCSDWSLVHEIAGHKNRINDIAVHPSGRLALTVGDDRQCCLFNLLKGRRAAAFKLEEPGLAVEWAPIAPLAALVRDKPSRSAYSVAEAAGGSLFAVSIGYDVVLHDGTTGNARQALEHPCRVSALAFLNPRVLLTAGEDALIRVWEIRPAAMVPAGEPAACLRRVVETPHAKRIRCMSAVSARPAPGESEGSDLPPRPPRAVDGWLTVADMVTTADSDGMTLLWSPAQLMGDDLLNAMPGDEEDEEDEDEEDEEEGGQRSFFAEAETVSSVRPSGTLKAAEGSRITAMAATQCLPTHPSQAAAAEALAPLATSKPKPKPRGGSGKAGRAAGAGGGKVTVRGKQRKRRDPPKQPRGGEAAAAAGGVEGEPEDDVMAIRDMKRRMLGKKRRRQRAQAAADSAGARLDAGKLGDDRAVAEAKGVEMTAQSAEYSKRATRQRRRDERADGGGKAKGGRKGGKAAEKKAKRKKQRKVATGRTQLQGLPRN